MYNVLTCVIVAYFTKYILCDSKYYTYDVTKASVTPYTPKVIDKTCLLEPLEGPCRSKLPMYYYKPETGNCSMFLWGGCQGNGNRFDTYAECQEKCLSKRNPSQFYRPKWCNLRFDYGYCFGSVERWYYDSLWRVCKNVIYSGCGGNKNNFHNKEQCDSMCQYGSGPLVERKIRITDTTGFDTNQNVPELSTSSLKNFIKFGNGTKGIA